MPKMRCPFAVLAVSPIVTGCAAKEAARYRSFCKKLWGFGLLCG
jgi:hypothetical protein